MFTVYVLIDPFQGCIRYVGRTRTTLHTRLVAHLSQARRSPDRHCCRWITHLVAAGRQPIIWPLEVTADPNGREIFWIAHYRASGCNLTNHTDGGDGMLGCKRSPESIEKSAAGLRGRKKRPLTDPEKENLRRWSTGRVKSPETLAKLRMPRPNAGPAIRAAKLGKKRAPFSKEWCARMSAGGKGKPKSEQHRQAIAAAHRAKMLERPGHNACLTPDQVREIRSLKGRKGLTQKAIGERYGVCQVTVWRIFHDEIYRWVR